VKINLKRSIDEMKKYLAMILALVMALSLVACGDKKDDTNTDDQDNNEVTDFKVGFIMLHDENSTYDLNFINAAKEACETLGVEYTIVTNVPEGQECYDKAAELADAGCNIIFRSPEKKHPVEFTEETRPDAVIDTFPELLELLPPLK